MSSSGAPSQRHAVTQTVTRNDRPDHLLENAPAAVVAAAQEVIEAHKVHDAQAPAPQKVPFVPKDQVEAESEESSTAHMESLPEGKVIKERYRVERLIGRGGMGTVYAVRHTNTDEKLALKLLHPALADNASAVKRFRTEARAPVHIESEHVVRVVDADVTGKGVPFMVMERLEGHDLRSELKRRGALPAGEVVLYLKQVARALDKAHAKNIVHRDLKPANIYILKREDGSPLVKVLDFGIAKLTDDAAKELTVAGQVFGTPWYMAPEQARGDLGKVGPSTDLWALGLIAFQLLTGQNYWTADGMAALVGQICYEPMPPPTDRAPHLGPLFDMWFARACHREPSERFSSARELVEQLAQALGVNQTGPGITTSGGSQRNMDSSLQLSGPHTPQPMAASSGGFESQASSSHGGGQAHPGNSIPGTVLAGGMDGTNAPLYATQLPQTSKSSPTLAVALGVVIALLVVGTGFGVYLSMPTDGTQAAAAPGGSASEDAEAPPDEAAEDTGAADDVGDDASKDTEGDDSSGADEEASQEDTGSEEADEAEQESDDEETKPAPPPPSQGKPTWKPPKKKSPPPPPPPPPKVAPEVDDVTF